MLVSFSVTFLFYNCIFCISFKYVGLFKLKPPLYLQISVVDTFVPRTGPELAVSNSFIFLVLGLFCS